MDRDNNVKDKATIKDIDATDKAFFKMIAPSILGIFACMICLVTLTWAWYTEGAETVTVIEAANYTATVNVSKTESGATVSDGCLEASFEYTVEITTNATDNTIGFCEVRINDLIFVTNKAGVTFTLTVDEDSTLVVDALWGSVRAIYSEEPPTLNDNGNYRLENGILNDVGDVSTVKSEGSEGSEGSEASDAIDE